MWIWNELLLWLRPYDVNYGMSCYFDWDFMMWIVGITMLYVVRLSECDHLEKHVACYEFELINDVDYELSRFRIGSEVFEPRQNLLWMSCNDFSDWICGDKWFGKVVFST